MHEDEPRISAQKRVFTAIIIVLVCLTVLAVILIRDTSNRYGSRSRNSSSPSLSVASPLQSGESAKHNFIPGKNFVTDSTSGSDNTVVAVSREKSVVNHVQHREEADENEHHHQQEELNYRAAKRVFGYMTVLEVSQKYGLDSDSLKRYLNIPLSVSDTETFGRLRKKYGFRMGDVEHFIDKSS